VTDKGSGGKKGRGTREGLIWNHLYSELEVRAYDRRSIYMDSLASLQLIMYSHITRYCYFFACAYLFFFSSSYLIVESRRPRTWFSISTFGRVSSQYVRSLNKILAHVYEKDWYIPDISCSYKMNTGSIILCLILILSVRLNASPSSLILEFRTILVDVKDMWIWKISIDHFRRSFGNELLEPRANCELGK